VLTASSRAIAGLTVALLLMGSVSASAQMMFAPESLERYFRIEWQVTQRIRLQIERVDASGSVVGTSTVWLPGDVSMSDRGYFSASVPEAASYRVQVLSFDWSCQGGGGGM